MNIFKHIKSLNTQWKLLLMVIIALSGFVCYAVYLYSLLVRVSINGPVFKEIKKYQNLVADILPPPEYIIEVYLTTLQMRNEKNPQSQEKLINKSEALKTNYLIRHEYWKLVLPEGDLKTALTKKSYESAMRFFDIVEKQYIPAVKANDTVKIDSLANGSLKDAYEKHRVAINNTVKLAINESSIIEKNTEKTIRWNRFSATCFALVILGVIISFAFYIQEDFNERKQAEDAMLESENRLKVLNENLETIVAKRTQEVRELSRALTVAEQRERQRMSHLLHEDLLQILLSNNMQIKMLSDDVEDNPEIMREVSEIKQMNLRAINSTNALAVEFNPPILKHEGLDIALKWLIRHFQKQYGLKVTALFLDPCCEMDPDIRFLLVQLVRELFLNIVKHAKTETAEFSVRCSKMMMRLYVRDHGAGFDVNKQRDAAKIREYTGLFSIEERMKLIGGRIKIVSVPGKGTIVRITVPIEVSFLRNSSC